MYINPKRRFFTPKHLKSGHMPLARRLRRLSKSEIKQEATAFLQLFFREIGSGSDTPEAKARMAEVKREISTSGTYTHSFEELEFGARVAWRNHARCIGRLYWRSLKVIDRRAVNDVDGIMEHMTAHMKSALNQGKIQSTLTVFEPVSPKTLPAHVESAQLTQYAGYAPKRGAVIGDRKNIEATRIAQADGWSGAGTRFDMLPVALITQTGQRVHRTLPDEVITRIPIRHEDYEPFNKLELEWYALPMISNMIMTIGGVDYPCAPFNGFYVATEIASRNFTDPWRFDLLKEIATAFGHDTDSDDPYWRDRTVTELNAAVLASYKRDGITLLDHHTASEQFMEFRSREKVAGRNVQADWSWIVPPQSSGITQAFHLDMKDEGVVPNYYHSWGADGRYLMPFYGDFHRSKMQARLDRMRRRYKTWARRPS